MKNFLTLCLIGLLTFLLCGILIFFNTLSFYQDKEADRTTLFNNYLNVLDKYINSCLIKDSVNQNLSTCLNDSQSFIKQTKPAGILTLKSRNTNINFTIGEDRFTEFRKPIVITRKLSNDDSTTITLTKATTPNILSSTLKSVTFSICSIEYGCNAKEYTNSYQKGGLAELAKFVRYVAFPRSKDTLVCLLAFFTLFYFTRKVLVRQFTIQDALKADLEQQMQALSDAQYQASMMAKNVKDKEIEILAGERRLQSIQNLLQIKIQERDALTESLQKESEEKLALETQYNNNNNDILGIQKHLAQAKLQLTYEQKNSVENRKKIEELQNDIQQQEQEIRLKQQESESLRATIQTLENEKNQQIALKVTQLSNEINKVLEDKSKAENNLQSLQQQNSTLQNEKAALEKSFLEQKDIFEKRLKKTTKDLNNKYQSDLQDLYEWQRLYQELENEKQKLAQEKEQVLANYQQAVQENNSLKENQENKTNLTRKKVVDILLKQPPVKKQKDIKAFKINEGSHHSKDFVLKVAERLKILSNYQLIEAITATAYNSAMRKKMVLEKKSDVQLKQVRYCLSIYDEQDEGFAAQVLLTAVDAIGATLQAKTIQLIVREFKNYELVMKVYDN